MVVKGYHGADSNRGDPPGLAEPAAVGCACSPGPENGTAGAFWFAEGGARGSKRVAGLLGPLSAGGRPL